MSTFGKILVIVGILILLFQRNTTQTTADNSPEARLEVNKQQNWPVFGGTMVVGLGIFIVAATAGKKEPS